MMTAAVASGLRYRRLLETVQDGVLIIVPETRRIIPDAELTQLGAFFPERHFGELIFLVEEGALIVPSHTGERPIRAMHGYHPDAPHSYASLLTNYAVVPAHLTAIPQVYELMTTQAEHGFKANHTRAPPPLGCAAAH